MYAKMGPIAVISFIVLALIGMSSANPVIGKKSNSYHFRYSKLFLNIGWMQHDSNV